MVSLTDDALPHSPLNNTKSKQNNIFTKINAPSNHVPSLGNLGKRKLEDIPNEKKPLPLYPVRSCESNALSVDDAEQWLYKSVSDVLGPQGQQMKSSESKSMLSRVFSKDRAFSKDRLFSKRKLSSYETGVNERHIHKKRSGDKRDFFGSKANVLKIVAPSGKLGVIIDTGGAGPAIIYEVKEFSPLLDVLLPGDKIVAIDEIDTRTMSATTVTKLMAKKMNQKRLITVIRGAGRVQR